MIRICTDELSVLSPKLRAGDMVELSGVVYTARDAAHKRICRLLDEGGELPFDLKGAVIYYAGPTQTPEGRVCGSFGPTTSCRMDSFTPRLIALGLGATIGKGVRSKEVTEAIIKYGAPYFAALGGAGALAASHIKSLEVIGFEELGCESVKRLFFDRFPLYVATDVYGGSIYNRG